MSSRNVAFGCIPLLRLRLIRGRQAPASCGSRPSRHLRCYESASTSITLSFMDQNLSRRPMARPKLGRSHPTTAAAAPATFRLVHSQVVGGEQMAIATDIRYGHGFEGILHGKAHHISFGCSKARPL